MQPDVLVNLIGSAVETAMAPLLARIHALEKAALVTGRDGRDGFIGPQGEKGLPGERGEHGPAGPDGPKGERGERGEVGPQGPEGPHGPPGAVGENGLDGREGRDGQPGVPGRQGEKGLDGINGRDGSDGKDGLGFDDLTLEYDGERQVTLKFVRGEEVKAFPLVLPMQMYRGLYKAGTVYARGDVVTWAGSSWHANEDTKAEPGAPAAASRAWAMMVRKGDTGKTGTKGETGERGPRGPEGPQGRNGY